MTPGSDIEHNASLAWGHWMRTVKTPHHGIVIIDEHNQEWRSVRSAFWCGRLNMSADSDRIVDESLELMLAVLISKGGRTVPFGEDVDGLFDGGDRFYRHFIYWLQATNLLGKASGGPFGAGTTAEGASVVRMLIATRPPELANIPVGPSAIAAFGPQDASNECNRTGFEVGGGAVSDFPYAIVRERRFRRHMVSLLYRNPEDGVPMARTIWSTTCADQASRDRLHKWLHDRMHRWSQWGEIARRSGAHALSQHLIAAIAAEPTFESSPVEDGPDITTDHASNE